jgi:hypothetical protein
MRMCSSVAAVLALSVTTASAQYLYGTGSNPNNHYVSPHTTSNGTYVSGHYQTNPNSTQRDNYGTSGNVNPYTGAVGTRGARY